MSLNKLVYLALAVNLYFEFTLSEFVEISDGRIEGTVLTTRLGSSFHAFLRIPFAIPPIGELRFEESRPVEPWSGVLDCTEYGPMCVQRSSREMSEDCLHLNVFTKSLNDSKPVIVYYHGGALESGSAVVQGPQNLMDRDVVLVTVNYRLGLLGFLATGTAESPGNNGLKDQILALKWVQKNIEKFGGDKTKVTIAGFSAGAHSVSTHMASPMASGLFHNVIAVSGSPFWPDHSRTDYLEYAQTVAKALNCTISTIGEMKNCLKLKNARDIVNVELKKYPECEIVIIRAVVEQDFGQQRYLPDDPKELFKSGKFSKVPIIIGRTSGEFIDVVPRLLNDEAGIKELNSNFDEMGPHCFYYERNTEKSLEISKAVRKAYLPFETIDFRSFNALNNLFADAYVGFGIHRFLNLISNQTNVFYYKFSFISRFSSFYYPKNLPYGVQHGDDMQYLMNTGLSPLVNLTDPEHFMVERMTRIWEHFASTSSPNYDPEAFTWQNHDLAKENYMEIGTYLVEKNGLFLERYAVWDEVLTSSSSNVMWNQRLLLIVIAFLTFLMIKISIPGIAK